MKSWRPRQREISVGGDGAGSENAQGVGHCARCHGRDGKKVPTGQEAMQWIVWAEEECERVVGSASHQRGIGYDSGIYTSLDDSDPWLSCYILG